MGMATSFQTHHSTRPSQFRKQAISVWPARSRRAALAADGSSRVTIGTCLLAGRMALAQCLHTVNASLGLSASKWSSVQATPALRTVSWGANIREKCLPQRLHMQPVAAHARHTCAASVLAKPSGETRAITPLLLHVARGCATMPHDACHLSGCTACRGSCSSEQASHGIHEAASGDHRPRRHPSGAQSLLLPRQDQSAAALQALSPASHQRAGQAGAQACRQVLATFCGYCWPCLHAVGHHDGCLNIPHAASTGWPLH